MFLGYKFHYVVHCTCTVYISVNCPEGMINVTVLVSGQQRTMAIHDKSSVTCHASSEKGTPNTAHQVVMFPGQQLLP